MSNQTINHGLQAGSVPVVPDTGEGDSGEDSSGLLSNIIDAITDIANKIKNLASNIVNPIVSVLTSTVNFVSNIASTVSNLAGNILDGIKNFFKDLIDNVAGIFEFLGNFFVKLLDFFIHIFVPSDEQWAEITENQKAVGETAKSHIPFVSLFSEEYKKAQATVSQNDFLVITIPSFEFSSGGITINQNESKVINVRDAYEPYRMYVRTSLFFIVIACAVVFLVKHVLNSSAYSQQGGVEK